MGFATWIIHLICRLRPCRWEWPKFISLVDEGGRKFIADTHHVSTGNFFFHMNISGAIRIQMEHVEFSCHSFFFFHAPSRSVFSLYASEPTVGLPAAFGCIRCHSFYLSVTLLPIKMWSIFIAIRSASHFIRISLRIHWRRVQLMRISFSFHCGYIGVGPN